MPWCPECGIEYRDGFDTCSDCGCKLTESPAQMEEGNGSGSDSRTESGLDREAFLTTAENSIEADLIEGLLQGNEIPILKKYNGAEDYMQIFAGGVNSNIDLYVPSHLLDKAKEILDANLGSIDIPDITDEELEAQALAAAPADEDEELDGDEEGTGEEETEE